MEITLNLDTLYIDFETRATVDIRKVGAKVYLTHPHTQMLCFVAHFRGKTCRHEPLPNERHTGAYTLPKLMLEFFHYACENPDAARICAHNAGFEWQCLERFYPIEMATFNLSVKMLDCTANRARYYNIPASLEAMSKVTNKEEGQKDMAGKATMLILSKGKLSDDGHPLYMERTDSAETNKLFDDNMDYCEQDVVALKSADESVPPTPAIEKEIQEMTFHSNLLTGVRIDMDAADAAIALGAQWKKFGNDQIQAATNGVIQTTGQNVAIKKFLIANGCKVSGVGKDVVKSALARTDLTPMIRKVLELKRDHGRSAAAKLVTASVRNSNGKIYDTLNYCGAHTHRFSSWGFQLHNLSRPTMSYEHADFLFTMLKKESNMNAYNMMFGSFNGAISDAIRGFIIPDKEDELLVAIDLSAIEARGLAYLAGQESVLKIYRNHGDTYIQAYSDVTGKPPSEVTKDERMFGKVIVLSLGYGGGVDALIGMAEGYSFDVRGFLFERLFDKGSGLHEMLSSQTNVASTLLNYKRVANHPRWYVKDKDVHREVRDKLRIKTITALINIKTKQDIEDIKSNNEMYMQLTDDLTNTMVKKWRLSVPDITAFWETMFNGAITCLKTGHPFKVNKYVSYEKKGGFLVMHLPSGNALWYMGASLSSSGTAINVLRDAGQGNGLRQVQITHGGQMAENVTQAWARDIFCYHMKVLRKELGVIPYFHVHDELVYSVHKDQAPEIKTRGEELMSIAPPWSSDVPLSAGGDVRYRYWKS